jgi:hypothetical protein
MNEELTIIDVKKGIRDFATLVSSRKGIKFKNVREFLTKSS